MSKWPQRWRDAVAVACASFEREHLDRAPHMVLDRDGTMHPVDPILDALAAIGALKEPPKPREFWNCIKCFRVFPYIHGLTEPKVHDKDPSCNGEIVHVREMKEPPEPRNIWWCVKHNSPPIGMSSNIIGDVCEVFSAGPSPFPGYCDIRCFREVVSDV